MYATFSSNLVRLIHEAMIENNFRNVLLTRVVMIVYDGRDGQIVFHFLYLVSGVKLIVADARNARQTHETRNKRAEFDSVSAH